MTPYEPPDFLGEALRSIEPKDDAHREKLERLQAFAQRNRETASRELAELERKTAPLLDPATKAKARAEADENAQAIKAYETKFDAGIDAHSDLIDRIVSATREGRIR